MLMRVLAIVATVVAFLLSARIADDPLVGLLVGAIVAAVLVLGQRLVRKRHQANPPKRP
ncbi:hypothetical protein [Massilia sp. BSC265]|uniref:hypothetical protein n=1 Tax=Massilia sp. BSC265 TaxID=1549812 RepID=UPI0013786349|nr:hypothetical protein [Massilia sp. BSC265]